MKPSISSVTKVCTLLLVSLVFTMSTTVSVAQESNRAEQRKTTKTPTMSEATYKKLIEAQELIEARQYEQGLVVLRAMESSTKLSSYERAQIFNFFAWLHQYVGGDP